MLGFDPDLIQRLCDLLALCLFALAAYLVIQGLTENWLHLLP